MGRKLSYEEVKEFIEGKEGNGCKLISTEYKNLKSKLIIKCSCGEIFEVSFDSFKNKPQRQCKKCGIQKRVKERSCTYEEVKKYIESKNCKLISTEYINNKTPLLIQCSCGNIFEERFDTFKSSNRSKCNECNGLINWTYEKVKAYIEGENGNGCKLLSTEYINNATKLNIMCSCGKTFETSLNQFKEQNKKQCKECGLKLKSGENHPRYNPDLTEEEREKGRYIQGLLEWRNEVYERDNYTCQCCGDNKGGNLNAHHINGYNNHKHLRIEIDNGITLCEDCHKEFHMIYGYGNNTWQQFREFLYNKYLQTNNLHFLELIETIDLRFIQLNKKVS